MRFIHNNTELITVVENDDDVIKTQKTISIFDTIEEAIIYFDENNIDYSILE